MNDNSEKMIDLFFNILLINLKSVYDVNLSEPASQAIFKCLKNVYEKGYVTAKGDNHEQYFRTAD